MTPDPQAIRRTIIEMCYRSNMAHIGCSLSVVEMLLAIYQSVDVEKIKQHAPDRDRILVSKGHCAAAVYATLAAYGIIDGDMLATYCQDGSPLAGLVSHAVPGVELSTGALGHGINVAVGCALGMKRKGYAGRVFCLVGDGEMQEGSVWEALMLASHHRLDNLVVLIDDNGIGSVTETERVMRLPLSEMLDGFGINVIAANGHRVESIYKRLHYTWNEKRPLAVICHTIKGKGFSLAENSAAWHYKSLTPETYAKALGELEGVSA